MNNNNRKSLMLILLIFMTLAIVQNCQKNSESTVTIGDDNIQIIFDNSLNSKVLARFEHKKLLETDYSASEYCVIDSIPIKDFSVEKKSRQKIKDEIGSGFLYTIMGRNAKLQKEVNVTLYDDFPTIAVFQVKYTNIDSFDLQVNGWCNHDYLIKAQSTSINEPKFWTYQGASYGWENDWVKPIKNGFKQENYMGMNWEDYGGGTPVVDIWQPDVGLAIGHVEMVPKLVSLPVSMPDDSSATIALLYKFPQSKMLKPGESFLTFRSFVAVHQGDFYNLLSEYSRFMQHQGIEFKQPPKSVYETIWCGWGYEEKFTMEQFRNTLPKVQDLGIEWAVLDYGWSTGIGDNKPDPIKFPNGDADMKQLVKDIHAAGAKAKLWWSPLTVQPHTELFEKHKDFFLLNEDGSPRKIEYWNANFLCPASEELREYTRNAVIKMIKEWGWDGLKIDGNHLNGVPPCYNKAHYHAYPEESVEELPDFFKMIYETALSINSEAVIEICPCGQTQSFYLMPYMNQAVASDPTNSWQIRLKGKAIQALTRQQLAYYGDHVELSDDKSDFASTVGIGGVIGTKFVWPSGAFISKESGDISLTPEKEKHWRKWIKIYNDNMLPLGIYRGELYDIGYDRPEAYAIQKDSIMYYAFYADSYNGQIELRGINDRKYQILDYVNEKNYGSFIGPKASLNVSFEKYLLVKAIPE